MNVEDFVKGIPDISPRVVNVSIIRVREWQTEHWRWEVVIEFRDNACMNNMEPVDVADDDLATALTKAVFELGGRFMNES
jgi:hypothetical protein